MRRELIVALLLACATAGAVKAQALPPPTDRVAGAVAEAVRRFGLPQSWIRVVIERESGGDPRATSPKGAMGLMQLMPDTWAMLRLQLGLGADPYDVHDNILAGAAYLRQLYDEFGPEGFLAAYNAGPRRYLDFTSRGRPLPDETRAYVTSVTRLLAQPPAPQAPADVRPTEEVRSVRRTSLFVSLDTAFSQRTAASSALFAATSGR